MALKKIKTSVSNAWLDDAVLTPKTSIGIIRPDELTFLYYPESGQGERFRKNNPGILNKIQAFNKQHVNKYSYLSGVLQQ